ncbi:2-hydroxychromene-2-carboxylate isomerase [Marinobacter halodurans]|uniref:2-hydroxychromene-2-carboxylate isomerase n=1 Tax=Marinobacter halodurans TaxID=2528979 RepID=A0ABY1ZQ86_9GAMM|nr:2-hydroxychromene-2-carboxylate isomerase [Marinobacter halodurans]TBW57945.1 2-hydroxychromene-2-carboxylate isomerase [Marinobacter halodurans]
MNAIIDVYFDVGSPASYLAWTQLPALADRCQARLNWRPMLLGAVFQATGNQSPVMIPAKGRYMTMDFHRFAASYGVPFRFNPHFPINTLTLIRGAVAFLDTPRFDDYLTAVFNAMWVDQKNMADPEVVASVWAEAGFDPGAVMDQCNAATVKQRLRETTDEAVEKGVFGAPTLFIGNEMFFGQDRLWQVEQRLQTNG